MSPVLYILHAHANDTAIILVDRRRLLLGTVPVLYIPPARILKQSFTESVLYTTLNYIIVMLGSSSTRNGSNEGESR